jgi:hypothetical protein
MFERRNDDYRPERMTWSRIFSLRVCARSAGPIHTRERGIESRSGNKVKRATKRAAVAQGNEQTWQHLHEPSSQEGEPSLRRAAFGAVPSRSFRPEVGPGQNRLEVNGRRFCKIVVGVASPFHFRNAEWNMRNLRMGEEEKNFICACHHSRPTSASWLRSFKRSSIWMSGDSLLPKAKAFPFEVN